MTKIKDRRHWHREDGAYVHDLMYPGKMTVTEADLRLLARMSFDYEEDGYEGVVSSDTKRPFGDSDIAYDILEILGRIDTETDAQELDDLVDSVDCPQHIARLAALTELARIVLLEHADEWIGKEIPVPTRAHIEVRNGG